jgi:glutamine amidotransferase
MKNIGLLNIQTGNINAVFNSLKKINNQTKKINNIQELQHIDIIFIAGVSSFDTLIKQLKEKNFWLFLKNEKVKKIIGICSGMQIMFDSSEEGLAEGLKIFPQKLVKFDEKKGLVPHIGWNYAINDLLERKKRYYFCHSYYALIDQYTIAKTQHTIEFSSIVKNKNFFGIQFHPEKSGNNGMELLKDLIIKND